MMRLSRIMLRRPIPRPGSKLCASLRRRHAHGHFKRAILDGNLQDASDTTSIEHRALTLTVRRPQCGQCGHAVWGNKHILSRFQSQGGFSFQASFCWKTAT